MRRLHLLLILFMGLLRITLKPVIAQQLPATGKVQVITQTLELGKPLGSNLKADQIQAYQLKPDKGEFPRATVTQQGIDVLVQVFGPDGTKTKAVN